MEPDARTVRVEELLAHREWVARISRALVADDARARDLEQDVWISVLRNPPRERPRSLRAWLGAVLRFRAVDALRSEGRRRRREEGAARPEALPPTDEVVARGELLKRLVAAVMELEEPYRSAVLLRWFEDLSPPEVAARQGVPLETVRTRLRRALERLRGRLDREHRGGRRTWSLLLLPLAGRPEPAAPGAVAAAGVAGGLLMTLKAKAAVAAAVLLVAAGAAWWGGRGPASPDPLPRIAATPIIAEAPAAPVPEAAPAAPIPGEAALVGRVIDGDTGEPLDGVRLRVAGTTGKESRECLSRADGAFSLPVEGGGPSLLMAEKTGFGPVERGNAAPGAPLTLRMRRLGSVAVRVRDARGDPVAGAEVTVLNEERRTLTAVTDIEGRARFEGLEPGTFMAGALPPSGRTDLAHGFESAVLLPGEVHEVVLDLGAGISCAGQVLDAETRIPVPGATILSVYGPRFREWTADGDGRFSFDHFRADRPEWGAGVLVRAGGYETGLHQFRPSKDREFAVLLRRAVAHRFRVTAHDGAAVPGARVVVYGTNRLPHDLLGEGTADGKGECVVGGLSPEDKSYYLVGAFAPDGGWWVFFEKHEGFPRGLRAEEAASGAVTLVLAEGAKPLTVRLRSERLPVEGRRVRLGSIPGGREYAFGAKLGRPPAFPDLRVMLPADCVREAKADPSGSVAFADLPAGACILEVEGRKDRGWTVGANRKEDLLEIDLDEALPPKHEVRGVVRTAAGPVAGAFVHLVTAEGRVGDGTVTGKEGRFRIETFLGPPARITVTAPDGSGGWRPSDFPAPAEGEEADLLVGE